MTRYIDADKLDMVVLRLNTIEDAQITRGEYKLIDRVIYEFPTIDAEPVIRCRDCKYYREDGDCWHEWDNDGRIYYQSVINEPNPEDYCSRAERKEE